MRFESHTSLHASGAIHRADTSLQMSIEYLFRSLPGWGWPPAHTPPWFNGQNTGFPSRGRGFDSRRGLQQKMQNAECRMQNEYAESMRSKRRTRGTTAALAWAVHCRPSAPPGCGSRAIIPHCRTVGETTGSRNRLLTQRKDGRLGGAGPTAKPHMGQ